MAFTNLLFSTDIEAVNGGEVQENFQSIILTSDNFADDLIVGRFAKIVSGELVALDGTATPLIAGIVLRDHSQPIEQGDVIDEDYAQHVLYSRSGMFTVNVTAAADPTIFDTVYASNQGDAEDGLATEVTTDNAATNCEFIKEIKSGVWLVRAI